MNKTTVDPSELYQCPHCEEKMEAGEPCPGCGETTEADEFVYCQICSEDIFVGSGEPCKHFFWNSAEGEWGGSGADDQFDYWTGEIVAALWFAGDTFANNLAVALQDGTGYEFEFSGSMFGFNSIYLYANKKYLRVSIIGAEFRRVPDELVLLVENGFKWMLTLYPGETRDAESFMLRCIKIYQALRAMFALVFWMPTGPGQGETP